MQLTVLPGVILLDITKSDWNLLEWSVDMGVKFFGWVSNESRY